MSKLPPRPEEHGTGDGPDSVFDRVRDRVIAAEAALAASPVVPSRALPIRALWRVFHDFGATYREKRRSTGIEPLQDVRDAARVFRRTPTLTALVAVATVLDEHGFFSRSA
jgi:hypothetical protein